MNKPKTQNLLTIARRVESAIAKGPSKAGAAACADAVDALRAADAELKALRNAAQRVAPVDQEAARVAWSIAGHLLKQLDDENESCGHWVVSSLSKLAQSHPRRPVVEVLALARHVMPKARKSYDSYRKDKS